MTMQTVALSALEPGRGNPRRAMDRRALEGALDVDRVGVVTLNQVAVIAVHRPHEIGERGEQALRQGPPESGALLRELQREIV